MIREESEKLLHKALIIEEENEDEAIQIYLQIIDKDKSWSTPYYNLGLIYKYRLQWKESYTFNLKAVELNPDDKAAWWNLGIASTALKKWDDARNAWTNFGIQLEENQGEVRMNIGSTPIRLKNGEVIWAERLCPARARIENIPLKDSGYRYNDLILNDGAPNGKRFYNEREYSVFDELELIEKSNYNTYSLGVIIENEQTIEMLKEVCFEFDCGFENWTDSIQILCKQCSEGVPHEDHDEKLLDKKFDQEYNLALATKSEKDLNEILEKWKSKTNVIINWIN